ncbi:MAG: DEAD/DEAH box helicase family protein [Acholeplasmataceae bacterium]
MNIKEAKTRIKINKMLEDAKWRFFDDENGPANIFLEPNVKLTQKIIDNFGDDFEKITDGFVDYVLVDDNRSPLIVVEAKNSKKNPLTGKEQARSYANSLGVKYIILTNGEIHYFWNLNKGNPELITSFPTLDSIKKSKALNASTQDIINTKIDKYYIAVSQDPFIQQTNFWQTQDEKKIEKYCIDKEVRILRDYQLKAIKSIQKAVEEKKTRFLLEMATGTGKTLTSAGIIKLFIRSEVANRVLFLVDRIELENQAKKDLSKYLAKDGITIGVYKENKDDWYKYDVLISTIQSFSFDNKYQKIFRPNDFDLIISDEAHRVLGASNRAIFEYFIGYKLGLTATPKNYLKGVDFDEDDPREIEKRILLDTYQIFGCDSGTPTFSYTLNDGVNDGYLVNPIVIDARSEITTQLLSDKGLIINSDDDHVEVITKDKDGKTTKVFTESSFEKTFFSESTNEIFCRTFLENAERDPITGEIGKTIFFCVNINHALKITQILNVMAEEMFPGKYNSDFAVQITSDVMFSQQMTINFANNNLNGHSKFLADYDSSKSRVAVTVGMMTTGYDCTDILNIGICRPIFSPSDFIQIKGRGTRLNRFKYEDIIVNKTHFKLFDFFGVCEYFEEDFNYDQKLKIIIKGSSGLSEGEISEFEKNIIEMVISKSDDHLVGINELTVGTLGMKIDRKFYSSFEEKIDNDSRVQELIKSQDIEGLILYLQQQIFNKPAEYFTVDKLEKALDLNRRLTIREIAFNILDNEHGYKNREQLFEDEFYNFLLVNKTEFEEYPDELEYIKELFIAYISDKTIKDAIDSKKYQVLINSELNTALKKVRNIKIKNMTLLEYIVIYVRSNDINVNIFY